MWRSSRLGEIRTLARGEAWERAQNKERVRQSSVLGMERELKKEEPERSEETRTWKGSNQQPGVERTSKIMSGE